MVIPSRVSNVRNPLTFNALNANKKLSLKKPIQLIQIAV